MARLLLDLFLFLVSKTFFLINPEKPFANLDQGAPMAEEEQRLQGEWKGQHRDGLHVLTVRK